MLIRTHSSARGSCCGMIAHPAEPCAARAASSRSALALRRRTGHERHYYRLRIRRVGPAAGTGARSLRRGGGRSDRHRGHGVRCATEVAAAGVRVGRCSHPTVLFWKNDSACARARASARGSTEAAFGTVPGRRSKSPKAQSALHGAARRGPEDGLVLRPERQPRSAWRVTCGPAGARVLDVCSYVGAWAVTALAHGAARAQCVDSSQAALRVSASRNHPVRNGIRCRRLIRADAFDALKSPQEKQRRALRGRAPGSAGVHQA